jgi:hypothetical protein
VNPYTWARREGYTRPGAVGFALVIWLIGARYGDRR